VWQRSPRPDLEALLHLQTIKSAQAWLLENDAVAVVNFVDDEIGSPGVYRVSKILV